MLRTSHGFFPIYLFFWNSLIYHLSLKTQHDSPPLPLLTSLLWFIIFLTLKTLEFPDLLVVIYLSLNAVTIKSFVLHEIFFHFYPHALWISVKLHIQSIVSEFKILASQISATWHFSTSALHWHKVRESEVNLIKWFPVNETSHYTHSVGEMWSIDMGSSWLPHSSAVIIKFTLNAFYHQLLTWCPHSPLSSLKTHPLMVTPQQLRVKWLHIIIIFIAYWITAKSYTDV